MQNNNITTEDEMSVFYLYVSQKPCYYEPVENPESLFIRREEVLNVF